MPLADTLLPLLRCPFCKGRFTFSAVPQPALAAAECGVLACQCGSFPVLDGIPIIQTRPVGMFEHTTGAAQVAGVAPARLVDLIRRGQAADALLECLSFPILPPAISRSVGHRMSTGAAATRLARWRCKRLIESRILKRRESVSAIDVFRFYQDHSPLFHELGHYFNLRFCQPRHLAALALLANVPAGPRPVLDVGCGLGHFEHYLSERRDPVAALGVDMNFFHVWIARHWVAPRSHFVCANVADGLPFADGAGAAVLCSDAYHYFPDRPSVLAEMARCAPGRPIVLSRVGNAAVMPNEGNEQRVGEYLSEIGHGDARAFDESDLLRAYLSRRNPLTESAGDPRRLEHNKWLSFTWNLQAAGEDPREEDWPHAAGRLQINPVYRVRATPDGGAKLRFEFPSAWYAYENHAMLSYHPRAATLTAGQLSLVRGGRFDHTFNDLVAQFVLIGLPQRFAPGA